MPVKFIQIIAFMFAVSANAWAHDPGLSKLHVVIDGSRASVSALFAVADLGFLSASMSTSKSMTPTMAPSAIRELFESQTAFAITANGRTATLDTVEAEMVEDNVLRLTGLVDPLPGTQISINVPMLRLLPRGHRQAVTLVNRDTGSKQYFLLNQNSTSIDVTPTKIYRATALSPSSSFDLAGAYVAHGFRHILNGYDHLIFLLLLTVPLVCRQRILEATSRDAVKRLVLDLGATVSAFTLAHTVTLTLTVLGIVNVSAAVVEPMIAVSLLITAWFNFHRHTLTQRLWLASTFGLIHGAGFAGFLIEIGFAEEHLLIALGGFTLGVEAGQLAAIGVTVPLLVLIRDHNRAMAIKLASLAGGGVAFGLLWQRLV